MSVATRVLRGLNSQSLLARAMSSYTYSSLNVTVPSPYVYSVEMNRPKKMNALNKEMWTEIGDVFTKLSTDPDCRVVVLSASGKMFSSGEHGSAMLIFYTYGTEFFNVMLVQLCQNIIYANVYISCVDRNSSNLTNAPNLFPFFV